MAEHEFLVTVRVDDWPEAVPDDGFGSRTEQDYAAVALRAASLPEAHRLDLWGDIEKASADIIDVMSVGG
jgi:hypothetical protein